MRNVDFGEINPVRRNIAIQDNEEMTILNDLAIQNEQSEGRLIDDAFKEECATALQKVKMNIWKSMLPGVEEEDAAKLVAG